MPEHSERLDWHARFLEQRDACDHHEHELDKARARASELEEALRPFLENGVMTDGWANIYVKREDWDRAVALLAPPSQEKPDYRPPVSPSDPENYSRHRPSQGSAQEAE